MAEIRRLTAADPKSLEQRLLKATEELGELAQAVLAKSGASGCAYKASTAADVQEETADLLLVVLSLVVQVGEDEVFAKMATKAQKWEEKL